MCTVATICRLPQLTRTRFWLLKPSAREMSQSVRM